MLVLFLFLLPTIIALSFLDKKLLIPNKIRNYWLKHIPVKGLSDTQLAHLKNHSTYYRQLTLVKQNEFEKRVARFITLKKFISRSSTIEVTEKMKVLISACAIQLAFGYPNIYFDHFRLILIYPDNYYSQITQQYHKGEVNSKGIIVLSWSNFLLGYDDMTDGINLGIHEMAHALHLENFVYNSEYKFIDAQYLSAFNKLAEIEKEKILLDENSFLRKYGGTNMQEFFAVVVENFFERPLALKEYNSELFHQTARILNQYYPQSLDKS